MCQGQLSPELTRAETETQRDRQTDRHRSTTYVRVSGSRALWTAFVRRGLHKILVKSVQTAVGRPVRFSEQEKALFDLFKGRHSSVGLDRPSLH